MFYTTNNRGFLLVLSMNAAPIPVIITCKSESYEYVYIRKSYYRLEGVGKLYEN